MNSVRFNPKTVFSLTYSHDQWHLFGVPNAPRSHCNYLGILTTFVPSLHCAKALFLDYRLGKARFGVDFISEDTLLMHTYTTHKHTTCALLTTQLTASSLWWRLVLEFVACRLLVALGPADRYWFLWLCVWWSLWFVTNMICNHSEFHFVLVTNRSPRTTGGGFYFTSLLGGINPVQNESFFLSSWKSYQERPAFDLEIGLLTVA